MAVIARRVAADWRVEMQHRIGVTEMGARIIRVSGVVSVGERPGRDSETVFLARTKTLHILPLVDPPPLRTRVANASRCAVTYLRSPWPADAHHRFAFVWKNC